MLNIKSFTYLIDFIHWCFTFSVVFHCCPIYVIFSLKWCSTVTVVVIFLYVWLKASPLSSLSSLVFYIILFSISNFIWNLMLSYCYTKLNGSKAYLYGNKGFDIWNYLKWLRIFSVSIPRALVLLILFNLKTTKGECSYYKYIKKLSLNPTPWHLPSYTMRTIIFKMYTSWTGWMILIIINLWKRFKFYHFMIYVFTPLCISSKNN